MRLICLSNRHVLVTHGPIYGLGDEVVGKTCLIIASTCTERYKPVNPTRIHERAYSTHRFVRHLFMHPR